MKRNEVMRGILEWIEEVGEITQAALSSGKSTRLFHQNLRAIRKDKLQKAVYRLKRSGHITILNYQETPLITLTDKGRKAIERFHFDSMQLPSESRWDGVWHIASFDIPERFKKGRDSLSHKLKSLGTYQLQKSVYVYPYRFEDEILFIADLFQVKQYLFYWEVKRINIENQLKKFFGLEKE